MFYPKVLSKNQQGIIQKLKLPENFYLGGGTALALQIGHRTSIDFDFYSQKHFESAQLVAFLQKIFASLKIDFQEEDTLKVRIKETSLSFFYYRYPLIVPVLRYSGIKIASLEDIAAMKIAAIVQRGTKRDFIDSYYLLQRFSLRDIIGFTIKKYPGYQKMLILRALIYFRDAEKEKYKRQINVFDPNFSWEEAKKKIFEEVRRYQLGMIKKMIKKK